jgi:hypothetical protein
MQCPEEGDFIWRKKTKNNTICKLLIPSDAKRSSATSRKCRAEYVKTLHIYSSSWEDLSETTSCRDSNVIYKVWEITKCDTRDEDRRNECSWWIHFFITRLEAEQYDA